MIRYIKAEIIDFNDEDKDTLYALARNPRTSPRILGRIIKSCEYDRELFRLVAGNPNTPTDTLSRLANDIDYLTVLYTACNKNTSAETLRALFDTRDLSLWSYIATNPNTPSDILDNLVNIVPNIVARSNLLDSRTRNLISALIHNPKVSAEDVRRLKALGVGTYQDDYCLYFHMEENGAVTEEYIQNAIINVYTSRGYTVFRSWLEHDIEEYESPNKLWIRCNHIINDMDSEHIENDIFDLMNSLGFTDFAFGDEGSAVYYED